MPLPKKKLNTNVVKKNVELPELEDATITTLDIEEQEYFDEQEYNEVYKSPKKKNSYPSKSISIPQYDEPLDEEIEEEQKYVDKKKKRIIPFGGKKSKIKVDDFDKRKDTLKTVKIVRFIVMTIILAILLISIKNTFFPKQIYTPSQIEQIAQNAVGSTGFPIERGKAFVENFIEQYVQVDKKNKINQQILSYFYSGKITENTENNSTQNVIGQPIQRVIIAPKVFESGSYTEDTAWYKVSVMVTDGTGNVIDNNGQMKAHWISFYVNVYRDKKTDKLAIHKDSPTVIPTKPLTNSTELPNASVIGNGEINKDMKEALTPTIDGFIQAFANVTVDSHNEIDQYIPSKIEYSLISGFGGTVKLANRPEVSITKEVYNTENPNEWKVLTVVDWEDVNSSSENQDSKSKITYKSTYVMTIKKTSENKYIVTKFVPYSYLPETKTQDK